MKIKNNLVYKSMETMSVRQFIREGNRWVKRLQSGEIESIVLTQKNEVVGVVLPPQVIEGEGGLRDYGVAPSRGCVIEAETMDWSEICSKKKNIEG